MKEEPDDVLATRAKAGDRRAFELLLDRHYDAMHRIAWRHCGDPTEAEDIAQDACIRVARAIGTFEGRSAFSTWVHAIVLNAVRDVMRGTSRRRVAMAAVAAMSLTEPAGTAEEDGREDALWSAVGALPDRQREAVQLVHVEGLSHREAASIIGCAEATVSWHLFAARRTLKQVLAGTEP
jgi:RNA polymerase sigma-70 factor (ECF subfamily)